MKSKRLWIEIGVLTVFLALIIAGVYIHNWWHSPGVHVVGDRARVEIYDTAYVIDFTSGELRGMADVVIDCQLKDGGFDGYIDVEGHHIPLESLSTDGGGAGGSVQGDKIEINYKGDNSYQPWWSNGEVEMIPPDDFVPWYDVTIDIDTEAYMIEITMVDSCLVVSAENEEAAVQRYKEFKQNILNSRK